MSPKDFDESFSGRKGRFSTHCHSKGKIGDSRESKNWIFESKKVLKMSLPNFNEVNIPSDSEEEDDYQGW